MKKFKISYNAPVVLTFVILCFLVVILGRITAGRSTQAVFMTYQSSLTEPMTYIRFFTHVLGHTRWEHFIGNASYLLLLGPILEEKYSSKMIFSFIVEVALATGIVNYIFFPATGLCGASGVVFGFIILASFTKFKDGEIPLSFILAVVIYLGQQVYDGLLLEDNISNMAHIIGGTVGAILGFKFNKN